MKFLTVAAVLTVAGSANVNKANECMNCCQSCTDNIRTILTSIKSQVDTKKHIRTVFDKLLQKENSDSTKTPQLMKATANLLRELTKNAYAVLYSFETYTFSPNETVSEIKENNYTDFIDEYQPYFDNKTGGMINLGDFIAERKMLGPKLLLLSFISNGDGNLKRFQNLTRKEWLSATACDTYEIQNCQKFKSQIKYFQKDLMIDLSSFNTLSKFIENNIDILKNNFNLNQTSYMGLMKYYINTISKYETESSSAESSATQAFSLLLLPMYLSIFLI